MSLAPGHHPALQSSELLLIVHHPQEYIPPQRILIHQLIRQVELPALLSIPLLLEEVQEAPQQL
jgi:hypothetical protein